MRFETPWMLLLLIPVIWIFLRERKKRHPSLLFPSRTLLDGMPVTWRIVLARMLPWLRMLTLTLLVLALARPQLGRGKTFDTTEAVAIEMVLDRSGSMAQQMMYHGKPISRFDVAKEVFRNFVFGDGKKLRGRPADLIGLIAFGTFADTICPLTLAHDVLPHFMKSLHVAKKRSEAGTAIGDAIALACARLRAAEKTLSRQQGAIHDTRIKSKVIILLTDGRQTAGKMHPLEAAELAKKWGIRIYTIGIGSRESMVQIDTPLGRYTMPAPASDMDEETLKAIARKTGGRYFEAVDGSALEKAYQTIDSLEKTDVKAIRFLEYEERMAWVTWPALILLILEFILANIIIRRIP
ncbi:MAG: VWA domain-containing protein [Lentisphaerae bacterium]|nr:MAG: VWA domain-containing protein [Lentisphaerota bacterium]